jgi:hypothetical protein
LEESKHPNNAGLDFRVAASLGQSKVIFLQEKPLSGLKCDFLLIKISKARGLTNKPLSPFYHDSGNHNGPPPLPRKMKLIKEIKALCSIDGKLTPFHKDYKFVRKLDVNSHSVRLELYEPAS